MTVRRARQTDAHQIAVVHVESWRVGYRGLIDDAVLARLSVERRAERWLGWLAPGGERALTLVGELAGQIAGFSTVVAQSRDRDEPAGVGEIPALYVAPDAWRHGVGTVLMGKSLEELRARGAGEAVLWMVEGNHRAQPFYEQHGWRLDGGRRTGSQLLEASGLVEVRFRRSL